jgi:hypothetical protein
MWVVCAKIHSYSYSDVPGFFAVIATIGILVTIVAGVVCTVEVSCASALDDKLKMYEDENREIEETIADIVTEYQNYERETFKAFSPGDAMTMVSLYPELKSDVLVQKQIETYVNNNAKIKELRGEKISINVTKWWLYFGGE